MRTGNVAACWWEIRNLMADRLTTAQRSALMARIRSAGNASTELRLVALLHAGGDHRHGASSGCFSWSHASTWACSSLT